MKSTDVSHKQKGGRLPSRLKLRLLRRDCVIERFDCPVIRTAEVCKVCCHLPTSGTQTCPFSEPSLLGYRAGVINKKYGCVWKCWCVSEDHRGEELWRQPLSEEAGSWRWACPLAAWVCGEPGSYKGFGKEGEQGRDRQEGRYRKRMGSECLPTEKRCAGLAAEGQLTKKASMTHGRIVCVFRCHWHVEKSIVRTLCGSRMTKICNPGCLVTSRNHPKGGSNISFTAQHVTHFLSYSQNTCAENHIIELGRINWTIVIHFMVWK